MINMKLIKLTDDHYVVVDETIQPVNGYYYDSFIKAIRNTSAAEYGEASHCWQITHSTQPMPHGAVREGQITGVTAISLQEVKEIIGEMDVEKKVKEYYEKDTTLNNPSSFKAGYNQALKDNKEKKYTEDDLFSAFNAGVDCEFGGAPSFDIWVKSIQPKTEWEVELETIDNRQPCDCSCHKNPNMVHFVACCNDGWIGEVTQKLKLK